MNKTKYPIITLALFFFCIILSDCNNSHHRKIKKAGDLIIKEDTYKTSYSFKVEGEFGWFGVSENRNKPSEKIIKIPFFRFKSRSSNPGSPVIYFSGGSGKEGIGIAKGPMYWLFDGLRDYSDIILVDQRGTGLSIPSLTMNGDFNLPLDQPLNSEATDIALRKTVSKMNDFLKKNNIDPSAYNTKENALDMKELILALGYEKANYGKHFKCS